jgi:hypothetical protein
MSESNSSKNKKQQKPTEPSNNKTWFDDFNELVQGDNTILLHTNGLRVVLIKRIRRTYLVLFSVLYF